MTTQGKSQEEDKIVIYVRGHISNVLITRESLNLQGKFRHRGEAEAVVRNYPSKLGFPQVITQFRSCQLRTNNAKREQKLLLPSVCIPISSSMHCKLLSLNT